MRYGQSLSSALQDINASKEFTRKHLGEYLYKAKRLWRAAPTDRIEAAMQIYERNRGLATVITTNSRDRSLIGEYFNAVKTARRTGNASILGPYENVVIVDADGTPHRLETDLERVYAIEERIEEPEFLELYQYR